MRNPDSCVFTKSHEWLADDGTVGLSDHAQHEITDVVFVELPKTGRNVKAGEAVAVVESVKAAFDIYAPVSGTIARVNNDLVKNPALLNQSPYGDGWLFVVEGPAVEKASLLSHSQYNQFVKTAER